MNIAFAATRLTKYDAASNYTTAVLEELSRNNKVDLYAFSVEREISKNVKQYNYTGKNKHNLVSVLSAIVRIYSLTKKFLKYDLVVLVGPDITVLPGIHLAKFLNPDIKLVWDFHGFTPPRFLQGDGQKFLTRIRQMASFWSMRYSDCIKVDSNYVKKEVESKIGKRDIKVLPVGINTTIFNSSDINTFKDRHLYGKFVMIYVGRLVASKRIDFLIKAMPALQEAVLLVVGDGDERDKLQNLVHSFNLKDKVIFIGRVSDEDLSGYYAASDVFVTASMHEGFCVPIIESFASGKPVIVPKRAAMPEIAGNAGLMYELRSMEDFISKVRMIKDNIDLRERLSREALKRSGEFDLKNSVKAYGIFFWKN